MRVQDFTFDLPPSCVATEPVFPRHEARLLHVSPSHMQHLHIRDFLDLCRPGDLVIFNDTKVIPARLYGTINDKPVECTLHKHVQGTVWIAFAKPAKRFLYDASFKVSENFEAKVLARDGAEVTLSFDVGEEVFFDKLAENGCVPLPPYITKLRKENDSDINNYQTIYAKHAGAVAAPTAGLHFTEDSFVALSRKKVDVDFLTLHVGAGTFLPVKTELVLEHKMHSEVVHISDSLAKRVNEVKKRGGRIIAIGTTVLRALEGAIGNSQNLEAFSGETNIFITPGYKFKVVDCLFTNFHLPESTLFMLVCAFSGINTMKKAYQCAIEHHYRFYSYGDACFLEYKNFS